MIFPSIFLTAKLYETFSRRRWVYQPHDGRFKLLSYSLCISYIIVFFLLINVLFFKQGNEKFHDLFELIPKEKHPPEDLANIPEREEVN